MKNKGKDTIKAAKGEANRAPNATSRQVAQQSHIGDRASRQAHVHDETCDCPNK